MPELKLNLKTSGPIRLMPLETASLFLPFGRPIADYLLGRAGNQNGTRALLKQGAIAFAPPVRWAEFTSRDLRISDFREQTNQKPPPIGPATSDPGVAGFLPFEQQPVAVKDSNPARISPAVGTDDLSIAKPRIATLPLRPRMTFGPAPAAKSKAASAPKPVTAVSPISKPGPAAVPPSKSSPAVVAKPAPPPLAVTPAAPAKAVAPTAVQPKPVTVIPPAPRPSMVPPPGARATLPPTPPQPVSSPAAIAQKPPAPKIATPIIQTARAAEPAVSPAPKSVPPTATRPVETVPAAPKPAPVITGPPTPPQPAAKVPISVPAKPVTTATAAIVNPKPPLQAPAAPAPSISALVEVAAPRPRPIESPTPLSAPVVDTPAAPVFEPHLTIGVEAESGSFLSKIPLPVKIGAAILILVAALYFVLGKGSAPRSAQPVSVGEQGWSTEWAGDAIGSRRGRQLTLYRPSVGMSDYQLQFAGQIESKALGWVFREVDTKNYYGMKIENLRPGAMAITHFAVVEGRESSNSQKPLGIDARPGATYRVKLDVNGPRFTLYIGDEPVDFWTDNHLKSGAVGFMNERDERGATSSVQFSFAKGAK